MTEIKLHNVETGEQIIREMNATELKQWEKDVIEANDAKEKAVEAAVAKAALLVKLGITEEEAKLLLS